MEPSTLEVMVRGVIDGLEKVGVEMRAKAAEAKALGGENAQAYAEGVAVTCEHAVKQLNFALQIGDLGAHHG